MRFPVSHLTIEKIDVLIAMLQTIRSSKVEYARQKQELAEAKARLETATYGMQMCEDDCISAAQQMYAYLEEEF